MLLKQLNIYEGLYQIVTSYSPIIIKNNVNIVGSLGFAPNPSILRESYALLHLDPVVVTKASSAFSVYPLDYYVIHPETSISHQSYYIKVIYRFLTRHINFCHHILDCRYSVTTAERKRFELLSHEFWRLAAFPDATVLNLILCHRHTIFDVPHQVIHMVHNKMHLI